VTHTPYVTYLSSVFLDGNKRRLRKVGIGTYDLSDILGNNITFYCALRCKAGFFDFRYFHEKRYIIKQNIRKIVCADSDLSQTPFVPIQKTDLS
jgi:hypothetical protein